MGRGSPRSREVLQSLIKDQQVIFTSREFVDRAELLGFERKWAVPALDRLVANGKIDHLKKGLYSLSSSLRDGKGPTDYQIALALVRPSTLSHGTALYLHGLSKQLDGITATIPGNKSIPPAAHDRHIKYIRDHQHYGFGFTTIKVDCIDLAVTDRERSLLDGLRQPKHCGGPQCVLDAIKEYYHDGPALDVLFRYAHEFGAIMRRRLGWAMERAGAKRAALSPVWEEGFEHYRKFDPSGSNSGPVDPHWKIVNNLPL